MQKIFLILAILFGLLSCKTTWNVHEIKTENIPNSEKITEIDSSIVRLITPYKNNLSPDMQQIIGFSTIELVKAKPESRLTNYLGDLILEEGKIYAKEHTAAVPDIAYLNYGGLRTDLPKGDITVGKIFELMPFENEIVLIKISGDNFYAFIEKIAAEGGDCVSGIKLGIKNGHVGQLTINGKPFARSSSYWIVTNDYAAHGGDHLVMFKHPLEYIATGIKFRDCIIEHMKKNYKAGKQIAPELDGRIYKISP